MKKRKNAWSIFQACATESCGADVSSALLGGQDAGITMLPPSEKCSSHRVDAAFFLYF
jgi:hypothetical protein